MLQISSTAKNYWNTSNLVFRVFLFIYGQSIFIHIQSILSLYTYIFVKNGE